MVTYTNSLSTYTCPKCEFIASSKSEKSIRMTQRLHAKKCENKDKERRDDDDEHQQVEKLKTENQKLAETKTEYSRQKADGQVELVGYRMVKGVK